MIRVSEGESLEQKSTVRNSWGQALPQLLGSQAQELETAASRKKCPSSTRSWGDVPGKLVEVPDTSAHGRERRSRAWETGSESSAPAVVVPLISSFVYLSFTTSIKRAVLLGDNK